MVKNKRIKKNKKTFILFFLSSISFYLYSSCYSLLFILIIQKVNFLIYLHLLEFWERSDCYFDLKKYTHFII